MAATATAGNLEGQGLAEDILAAHNAVRKAAEVPALTWSVELAAFAQQWANELIARGQFVHRRNSSYGENLFEITGAKTTLGEVVNQWASGPRTTDMIRIPAVAFAAITRKLSGATPED